MQPEKPKLVRVLATQLKAVQSQNTDLVHQLSALKVQLRDGDDANAAMRDRCQALAAQVAELRQRLEDWGRVALSHDPTKEAAKLIAESEVARLTRERDEARLMAKGVIEGLHAEVTRLTQERDDWRKTAKAGRLEAQAEVTRLTEALAAAERREQAHYARSVKAEARQTPGESRACAPGAETMTGPGLAKCPRIGRSMLLALRFVAAHPGCTKFACARHIGCGFVDPAHSPGTLYETIDRCVALGFVDAQPHPERARAYALHITARGAALLAERT